MRIQKAPRNGSERSSSPTALTMHERLLWKDMEDIVASSNKELASQLFVKHVMLPLLGSKYVDSGVCSFPHTYICKICFLVLWLEPG